VKRLARSAVLVLTLHAASPASATPPPSCSVAASGLNFGVYTATSGPVAFTGEIHVQCSGGPGTFTVALTAGSSGNATMRQMRAADGRVVRYQLYLDPARTRPWGDGANGGIAGPFSSSAMTLTVYGLLFSGQHVPAARVTDTVQAILSY
jgi:spore coat protein U-like protein